MLPLNEPRYTLECCGLPWRIGRVDEETSLARPPSVVLEVFTDQCQVTGEIERMRASLLIEGQGISRVVHGWIRYVEHLGNVGSQAHLRLHFIPTHVPDVRRIDVRGEDASIPKPPAKLERTQRIEMELRGQPPADSGGPPSAQTAAPALATEKRIEPHHTAPLTWQELETLHQVPTTSSASPDPSKPTRSAIQQTQLVSPEDLAALRELKKNRFPKK